MEDYMDYADNRNEDPDFEPQKKKQKKNSDIISNELMLYVINTFGKRFYTEDDRAQRKLLCERIRDNLFNEKSAVIESDILYDNLMSHKRTFLREKKKNHSNPKWPFFEAFMSLGSCIRMESSSSSDKKSSSSSSKSHSSRRHSSSKSSKKSSSHKESSSRKESSSHKESKKSSKDDSVALANASQSGIGTKVMFGGCIIEKPAATMELDSNAAKNEPKEEVMNTSANNEQKEEIMDTSANIEQKEEVLDTSSGPSTSANYNTLHSTPKSEREIRPRGYLLDNGVDVKDKLDFFFGKCNSEEIPSTTPPSKEREVPKLPEKFESQEAMIAYLNQLIPKSSQEEKVAPEEPVSTQIDPMDYINPTQAPVAEEEDEEMFLSQYPATQQLEDDRDLINDTENNDKNEQDMTIDDNKPPIDDSRAKSINSIMNEVMENKAFDKINEVGATSDQIKELKELFNENESRIAELLELEEKIFKMQHDVIKSELKFKAKLVEILENIHK